MARNAAGAAQWLSPLSPPITSVVVTRISGIDGAVALEATERIVSAKHNSRFMDASLDQIKTSTTESFKMSQETNQGIHGFLGALFHQPMAGVLQFDHGHIGRDSLHLRAEDRRAGLFASDR